MLFNIIERYMTLYNAKQHYITLYKSIYCYIMWCKAIKSNGSLSWWPLSAHTLRNLRQNPKHTNWAGRGAQMSTPVRGYYADTTRMIRGLTRKRNAAFFVTLPALYSFIQRYIYNKDICITLDDVISRYT